MDSTAWGSRLEMELTQSRHCVSRVRLKPGYTCATISLTVNMQSAGQEGHFIAVAGVDRVGRQIAFAQAKLYDAERSRLIANATSSLAVMPVRR